VPKQQRSMTQASVTTTCCSLDQTTLWALLSRGRRRTRPHSSVAAQRWRQPDAVRQVHGPVVRQLASALSRRLNVCMYDVLRSQGSMASSLAYSQ
jgi:hypothetical protein